MKASCRLSSISALSLMICFGFSGCSLISTTRKLPVPKAPASIETVTPEVLVASLNQRWAALDSLNATVEIKTSVLKPKEGVANDYTTIRGHILMRKPELLRVLGQIPVLGTRAFDMASDGKNFTLWIPHNNKAYKGSTSLKKKSANKLENLRPGFFFDAMIVRGLEPDDLYAVTADTITVEDTEKKHLYSVPEYVLSIMRRKAGSQELTPVRVVRFHRDDLLPYQQDLYDSEGNLETQVAYKGYQDFGTAKYPSTVVIIRPLDDYQVVLTVEKVVENMALTDDQFVVKPTEGTQIQFLE